MDPTFHGIWRGFCKQKVTANSSVQLAVTFCWQKFFKNQLLRLFAPSAVPPGGFLTLFPPEETHMYPSHGMKVSLEWHESLHQGRSYSVTLSPAFSHWQGYRIRGHFYITYGCFEAFLNHPPTYVRTFSLHKVRENCHFIDHPPTPMSLRNIKMAP